MRPKTVVANRSEIFIIFAYLFYVTIEMLNTTQFRYALGWETLKKIEPYISLILILSGIILNKKISIRWLEISVIIAAVSVLIILKNENAQLIIMMIVFVSSGALLKSDRVFFFYVIVGGMILSICVAFTMMGIFDSEYYTRGQDIRYYLGFSYSTYAPNYFMHIVFSYFAQKKNSISKKETYIIFIVNVILYILTDTKAVFYEISLLLLILWIIKKKGKLFNGKIIRLFFSVSMPIFAISSIVMAFVYNAANPIHLAINSSLSDRLRLGNIAINRYGFNLFGNPIVWMTNRNIIKNISEYFFVDSAYLNIALSYGLITLLFLTISFSVISYKAHKKGNIKLCAILFVLALHSFSDPQLFDLKYDPFLLLLLAAYLPSIEHLLSIGLKKQHLSTDKKSGRICENKVFSWE